MSEIYVVDSFYESVLAFEDRQDAISFFVNDVMDISVSDFTMQDIEKKMSSEEFADSTTTFVDDIDDDNILFISYFFRPDYAWYRIAYKSGDNACTSFCKTDIIPKGYNKEE